jgi:hypothetical protein
MFRSGRGEAGSLIGTAGGAGVGGGVAERWFVTEGNGKAVGVVGGDGEAPRKGVASASSPFDGGKYSSLWGTEMRSMVMPGALMGDAATDEGCRECDREGGNFSG